MHRIRSPHLIVWVVGLLLEPALCGAQEIPRAISRHRWAESRESRRAQAAEWLTEITKIEKQIPTLSPAEEQWLRVEYDDEIKREGHFTPRAVRAMASREFSARATKPVAQAMIAILEPLAAPSLISEGNEVVLWTRLAYLALDGNFWGDIASLGEQKVLERDPKSKLTTREYAELLVRTWASRSADILGQIVLPHLGKAGNP